MDPLRLGPTKVALDNSLFQGSSASGAAKYAENSWVVTSSSSTLQFSIIFEKKTVDLDFMDGIWRIKLSVKSPEYNRQCQNVKLELTTSAKDTGYYIPYPAIHVSLDGVMNLYAIRGNGRLRPIYPGNLMLTFNCPAGTLIQWGGAQLLRVTMPEAARDLIQNGTPINPYQPDDIY